MTSPESDAAFTDRVIAESTADVYAQTVQRVRTAIVADLARQSRDYAGFTALTTTNPHMFVVDGILTVDELAAAVVADLAESPPAIPPSGRGIASR